MHYSSENIFHFTCEKCSLWWSVATERLVSKGMTRRRWETIANVDVDKVLICPHCGNQHVPPHLNTSRIVELNAD